MAVADAAAKSMPVFCRASDAALTRMNIDDTKIQGRIWMYRFFYGFQQSRNIGVSNVDYKQAHIAAAGNAWPCEDKRPLLTILFRIMIEVSTVHCLDELRDSHVHVNILSVSFRIDPSVRT